MILTVNLPDDVGLRLRERASRGGQTIEEYVLYVIKRDAATTGPVTSGDQSHSDAVSIELGGGVGLSDDDFEVLLNELAAGPELSPLPADFSRADIYSDHD